MVFLEFHADHGVDEEVAFCREVFEAHGVERFEVGDRDAMADLWQARRDLTYAILAHDPRLAPVHPGDVTVPLGSLGTIIDYARSLADETGLLVPCFGHAGDGNLHYTVLVDRDDLEAVKRGEQVYRQIVERAIELGGTATGEHGIGLGKREYLVVEHGAAAVELMRTIKQAFDPRGTLNPGKILPEVETERGAAPPSAA